jgi:hypothetical protein
MLMLKEKQLGIVELALKTIVVHTTTYFVIGVPLFLLFNYSEGFTAPELACWMRPTNDPLVSAGLLFQPIRGLIFALAFFPIREKLFGTKNGWLIIWWLLVALGILSTFGPAPGSVEGMVYTILPLSISTYLEVVLQSLSLSGILFLWVNNSNKRWLTWVLSVFFVLILLAVVFGLFTNNIA